MNTVYLNMRTSQGVETVDEFTRGQDAPENWGDFFAYVREMIRNYHESGMSVYRSSRATKEWREGV